jgi:malonyl-CoA decarboxylase
LLEQIDAGTLTPAELGLLGTSARRIAALDDMSWLSEGASADRVRAALLSAAARYLMETSAGRARDPVANFHLSNGASLERLNWLANPASYGLEESLGVMVNYRYDRSRIASNAGAYLATGQIRTSGQVRGLVKSTKA